jgi:arsenate reductase
VRGGGAADPRLRGLIGAAKTAVDSAKLGLARPCRNHTVLIVYGIQHCDTVAAACKWLREHGIAFEFHDLRKDHLDARTIESWIERLGSERLLNKSSATWRTLDSTQRALIESGNPVSVIIANPTLIRRPVLVDGDLLHNGFDPVVYESLFSPD